MNKLMSKWFSKWAKKSKIDNKSLLSTLKNIGPGNVVDLGSGLYKIKVSRPNQGKSGGFRTLVIYKKKDLALFVYGFAKNEKDNISYTELSFFKKQAKHVLNFNQDQINYAINCGEFIKLGD